MAASVLVVDDDKLTRWSLGRILARMGCEVREATSGDEGLAAIRERRPDLVLLDIILPDVDGLRVLEEVRRTHPDLPVLLMTAQPSPETRRRAQALHAEGYLEKPCHQAALERAVGAVLSPRGDCSP